MAVKPMSFKDLSGPWRIGVVLASGGGLLTVIWAIARELPLWIGVAIIVGMAAVGVLLLLYARLLKWRRARQAKPMEQQVLRSTSAGQQSISDPEQLARIDDLRKRFEEGIGTFRAAGKSLYSLPWYLILGEPGSGKTEAIRHCNVGFPPGLHDRYQGVGGTINMNWWFTDHGVIVDTAGRLMFEEAQSGGTREWKEFLGLLRKSRPNCPVNGVLLVIPADSLIRDSAEDIERKASQIAQQFDVIQRTLDVRFPVYVVVTKSDLINGFREFFDKIVDPQLQHQILGWSNPGELDQPYDPRIVDKYLEEINTRLFRTRLTRLGELVCDDSEDEEKPTTDALYAFPYALEQLGPRLKRYLDLIFSVGSQWSCKPLFFRGIYFTSSMQEGAALDEDLATALGVPVESLPEGPVWRRDRAYFLRDLFVSKLFAERGLVTRATNAHKQYARRRAAIMACAAVGLVVLISLVVYGGIQFRRSVGRLQNTLELATDEPNPLPILGGPYSAEKYKYKGNNELDEGLFLYDYFTHLTDQALAWNQNEGIPRLFRPAVRWADINVKLQDATKKVYRTGVLEPLLRATAKKMAEQNNGVWSWDHNEPRALYQLIALRAQREVDPQSAAVLLDPLMQYIRPDGADRYPDHKKALTDPLRRLYDSTQHPSFDETLLEEMDKAIENGAELFKAYWSGEQGELNAIREVARCLADSNDITGGKDPNNLEGMEERLLGRYLEADPNTDLVETWLTEDYPRLQGTVGRIGRLKGELGQCASLHDTWALAADRRLEAVQSSYDRLLDAFGPPTDANRLDSNLAATYEELRLTYEQYAGSLDDAAFKDRLGTLDEQFWANNLYNVRFSMCEIATNCLKELKETQIEDMNDFLRTEEVVRKWVNEATSEIEDQSKKRPKGYHVEQFRQLATSLVNSGERRHYRAIVGDIDRWLRNWTPPEFRQMAPSAHTWEERHQQLSIMATAPEKAFAVLSGIRKELEACLGPLGEHWPDNKTISDFRTGWSTLQDDNYLRTCSRVLSDWERLGGSAREARKALLGCPADKFLLRYFVSHPRPAIASPDRYWYELAVTSLDLLAREVERDMRTDLKTLAECQDKYPLNKLDQSNSLTSDDVARIHNFREQFLTGKYAPNTIGAGADTGNADIDTLLAKLRGAVEPPDWIGKTDVLPPPNSRYWCQIGEVKTTPPLLVREIVISKGPSKGMESARGDAGSTNGESITWNDMSSNAKTVGSLPYDCSEDMLRVAFYAYPGDRETRLDEKSFPGPWAWHRMLEEQSFNGDDCTYLCKYDVPVSDKKVTIEITLRFCREKDCTDPAMDVLAPRLE